MLRFLYKPPVCCCFQEINCCCCEDYMKRCEDKMPIFFLFECTAATMLEMNGRELPFLPVCILLMHIGLLQVFTRDMAGLRGYCVAFLAAFDKHWNLALEDVREVWTRWKRNKVPALGKAVVGSVVNCSLRWYTLRAHALWSLKPLTQTLPTGWIRISNQFLI